MNGLNGIRLASIRSMLQLTIPFQFDVVSLFKDLKIGFSVRYHLYTGSKACVFWDCIYFDLEKT
jgi:hypothetical protein